MKFNHNKLRGKIKEVYLIQDEFAKAMGLSRGSISNKLNGNVVFSQIEIRKAVDLLGIKEEEIWDYFFNLKV